MIYFVRRIVCSADILVKPVSISFSAVAMMFAKHSHGLYSHHRAVSGCRIVTSPVERQCATADPMRLMNHGIVYD